MRATPILRCVLIAATIATCHYQAGTYGQEEGAGEPDVKQQKADALASARTKLIAALGDKPDKLSIAAQPFLLAAQDPTNLQGLHKATENFKTELARLEQEPGFRSETRVPAARDAIRASDDYQTAAKLPSKPTPTPSALKREQESDTGLMTWVWPIAGGVAALGLIVLAVFGLLRLRSGFWRKLDGHINDIVSAHVGELRNRQGELAKHVAAMEVDLRKTSPRLESIEGEIQALVRRLRQSASEGSAYQGSASVRQAFDQYARPPAQPVQRVEPEFPASADEYLNKMKRNSLVVKPDFQNGILVNDSDGKGELVLIRDSSIPDDAQPLFVVPRVTQFQTKQEFHSYYERYYECQKPSAGDVWIIDPAIVSTVPGGWELREKGVLEVR
jgi:hypothetical protein